MSTVSSLQHDGLRSSYAAHRLTICDKAASLCATADVNGLLGFLLSAKELEEILTLQQNPDNQCFQIVNPITGIVDNVYPPLEGYFELLLNPGKAPVKPAIKSAADASKHNCEIASWKLLNDDYIAQRKGILELTDFMLATMDNVTKDFIRCPQFGYRHLSAANLLAILDKKFLVATVADFNTMERKLEIAFKMDNNIYEFVQTHRTVATYFAKHGQPLNEYNRLDKFKRSLTQCKMFDKVSDHYFFSHPSFQDQKFEDYANAIITEWESIKANGSTSASSNPASGSGYAGATSVEQVTSPVPTTIEALAAQVEKLTAAAAVAKKTKDEQEKAKAKAKAKSEKYQSSKNDYYCHTHGCNFTHNSNKCRFPGEGHQKEATLANQMGGKAPASK